MSASAKFQKISPDNLKLGLVQAIENGQLTLARYLLKQGADLHRALENIIYVKSGKNYHYPTLEILLQEASTPSIGILPTSEQMEQYAMDMCLSPVEFQEFIGKIQQFYCRMDPLLVQADNMKVELFHLMSQGIINPFSDFVKKQALQETILSLQEEYQKDKNGPAFKTFYLIFEDYIKQPKQLQYYRLVQMVLFTGRYNPEKNEECYVHVDALSQYICLYLLKHYKPS